MIGVVDPPDPEPPEPDPPDDDPPDFEPPRPTFEPLRLDGRRSRHRVGGGTGSETRVVLRLDGGRRALEVGDLRMSCVWFFVCTASAADAVSAAEFACLRAVAASAVRSASADWAAWAWSLSAVAVLLVRRRLLEQAAGALGEVGHRPELVEQVAGVFRLGQHRDGQLAAARMRELGDELPDAVSRELGLRGGVGLLRFERLEIGGRRLLRENGDLVALAGTGRGVHCRPGAVLQAGDRRAQRVDLFLRLGLVALGGLDVRPGRVGRGLGRRGQPDGGCRDEPGTDREDAGRARAAQAREGHTRGAATRGRHRSVDSGVRRLITGSLLGRP